jgi:hypothetical protein
MTVREFSIKQEYMYNMDETGFQLGVNKHGKINFIGLEGQNRIG